MTRNLPAVQPGRLVFLDGLRGWAALFVVLYHVFCDGFPPTIWAATELRKFLPFNGSVAVGAFFVVSGFSLAAKFVATGERRGLLRMAAGRYVRLAVPILVACTAVHLLMVAGAIPADRPPPFSLFLDFEPRLDHLLRFSLYEVFVSYSYTRSYIGPLWTIPIEALGSVLVLGMLAVVGRRPWRWAVYAVLTVSLLYLGSFQALFVIGVVMAELVALGWLERAPQPLYLGLFLVGCAVPFLIPWQVLWITLPGVAALCLGAIGYRPLRRVLSGRWGAALGTLSFPLYLAHGPIMFVVGLPLMQAAGPDPFWKVLTGLVVVGISVLAALPLIPVNEAAVRLAQAVGRAVVSGTTRETASESRVR